MMSINPMWDSRVRFVITDVDDTLAPAFGYARQEITQSLSALIRCGVKLLFVSGQSITNIFSRVVTRLPPELRRHVLVAHCNGSEVFGFSRKGELILPCLWSSVTPGQQAELRATLDIVKTVLSEFRLTPIRALRPHDTRKRIAAILDDRRVQISIDLVEPISGNTDQELRSCIAARVNELLAERAIYSIEARLGGVSGIDCLPSHVNKGLPVRKLTQDDASAPVGAGLASIAGFSKGTVCEVWGDQFSVHQSGNDTHMALAAPAGSRIISFRALPSWDIPQVPGMRIWTGPNYLDAGLADYLLTIGNSPTAR